MTFKYITHSNILIGNGAVYNFLSNLDSFLTKKLLFIVDSGFAKSELWKKINYSLKFQLKDN